MNIKEKIQENIASIIHENGFFLIEVIIRGTPQKLVIEVYADSEKNMSAEDCSLLSHQITQKLDEFVSADYRLDVSSPGIDRPLKFLKQYPKNIGRKFEIKYKDGELVKKFTGKLIEVKDSSLVFEIGSGQNLELEYDSILKALVTISFS